MSLINVPIAIGELIDKITILEIKSQRMRDVDKLDNVTKELKLLTKTWLESGHANATVEDQWAALRAVNEALWDIEDQIRHKEIAREFDERFVELARAIYRHNDRRAALKREINLLLGSEIVEEKSYPDYAANLEDALRPKGR